MNNSEREKTVREPLFHIEKRGDISRKKGLLIRGIAILAALIVSGVFSAILLKGNPFVFYEKIIDGAVGTERRIWNLLRETALLLGVALAIVPAFKMKFWNLGGNGQVLVGCLATTACMFYFGGKVPLGLLIVFMMLAGVIAGAIWALIPAIFKAQWKTNESLFTLMMNYIAEGLVAFFLTIWVKTGSGVLNPMRDYKVPEVINSSFIPIIVIVLLTAAMYIYLKYSKQGYEISVVGESENTARYVGINVKKVVIRTLIISGAICGLVGFLLSGAIHGTVSKATHGGMGFTAIMVAWLAKFNPLIMAGTSFFVVFLERGVAEASSYFGVTNTAFPDIVTSIIFFFIIGCEFFIQYRLRFRAKKKSGIAAEKTVVKAEKKDSVEVSEESDDSAKAKKEDKA
ncbi:MAG: ABC transporter permease [Clostridia bacterium]|nr:ABC transporter permease [Clostridia bacterium]